MDAGRVTACGGREKVLQVWWARRARAIGNVAALAAPRRRGLGTEGAAGALPSPEGGGPLECSERVVGAERVGGGAHPVSSLWGKGRRVAAWVGKGR